jgi:glutathione S-transferase
LRLYDYPASANCYKPRLLIALLGREYERVPVDIFGGDTLTEEYAALNPARETPVLELEDGRVLTQSDAILWYLAEGTAFLPEDPFERGQVAQWLFFEQERVMSGIGSARFRMLTGRNFELVPARLELARSALAMLEAHLERRSYLVGSSCSIADLANFAYTHVAPDAGFQMGIPGRRRLAGARDGSPGLRRRPSPVPRQRPTGRQQVDLRRVSDDDPTVHVGHTRSRPRLSLGGRMAGPVQTSAR